jgi:hypothetical protein
MGQLIFHFHLVWQTLSPAVSGLLGVLIAAMIECSGLISEVGFWFVNQGLVSELGFWYMDLEGTSYG